MFTLNVWNTRSNLLTSHKCNFTRCVSSHISEGSSLIKLLQHQARCGTTHGLPILVPNPAANTRQLIQHACNAASLTSALIGAEYLPNLIWKDKCKSAHHLTSLVNQNSRTKQRHIPLNVVACGRNKVLTLMRPRKCGQFRWWILAIMNKPTIVRKHSWK